MWPQTSRWRCCTIIARQPRAQMAFVFECSVGRMREKYFSAMIFFFKQKSNFDCTLLRNLVPTPTPPVSVHPDVAESVDMSQPLYWDRLDVPLPDRAYKEVLTDADKSLKQKEKGPWSQLSKEEKIACRFFTHSSFCQKHTSQV